MDAEIMRINSEQKSSFHDHNFLSDYTEAEYKKLLGLKKEKGVQPERQVTYNAPEGLSIPAAWNWVAEGAVNPIQDQGQCGSCWAFSAAAAMESAHYISYGAPLLKLSE